MTESFRPGEVGQCRALARAFLFRFFENEITAGSSDLRSSFFWLLSILIPPGMNWVQTVLLAPDKEYAIGAGRTNAVALPLGMADERHAPSRTLVSGSRCRPA